MNAHTRVPSVDATQQDEPGVALGLPRSGPGALASWGSRLAALLIDWSAAMLVAMGIFGPGVMTGSGWRVWMPMAVFFVQKAVLTWLLGASFGQRLMRVQVARLDGGRLTLATSVLRAALVCLVAPAVVVGPHRRALDDLLLNTVVLTTR